MPCTVSHRPPKCRRRPLLRVLRVAFRRALIEHAFRLAKQEAGRVHYEGGRQYGKLVGHLVMAVVVLGFVAEQTARLRGNNPEVTVEQVCRVLNQRCGRMLSRRRGVPERRHLGEVICYHQWRNAQTTKSHKKRRHKCGI